MMEAEQPIKVVGTTAPRDSQIPMLRQGRETHWAVFPALKHSYVQLGIHGASPAALRFQCSVSAGAIEPRSPAQMSGNFAHRSHRQNRGGGNWPGCFKHIPLPNQ